MHVDGNRLAFNVRKHLRPIHLGGALLNGLVVDPCRFAKPVNTFTRLHNLVGNTFPYLFRPNEAHLLSAAFRRDTLVRLPKKVVLIVRHYIHRQAIRSKLPRDRNLLARRVDPSIAMVEPNGSEPSEVATLWEFQRSDSASVAIFRKQRMEPIHIGSSPEG